MSFPDNAQEIYVWVAKACSIPSIIGSSLIIRDCIINRGTDRKKLNSLIMIGLSVGDIGLSFLTFFMGSWMIPKGVAPGAIGTTFTCTFQAYVGSIFAVGSVGNNISLVLACVLMVRYGWKQEDFGTKAKVVLVMWGYLVGVIMFIPVLMDQAFNYTGLNNCYIAASPLGCDYADPTGESCERGKNAQFYNKISTAKTLVDGGIILVLVLILVWTVLQTERKMDRFLSEGQARNRKRSLQTGWQAIWYVAAYFLTYLPWIVLTMLNFAGKKVTFGLLVWTIASLPLQGFFNSLVYFRPKYIEGRKEYGRVGSLSRALRFSRLTQMRSSARTTIKPSAAVPTTSRIESRTIKTIGVEGTVKSVGSVVAEDEASTSSEPPVEI